MYRHKVFVLGLVFLSLAAVAVTGENVLSFGAEKRIDTLDPAKGQFVQNNQAILEIYETLIRYDPKDFALMPLVAESWLIAPDGTSITFNIRQGMKFHDGTPVNAEAVKYSYDRMVAVNAAPASMFAAVSGCQVVDEYTVKFASQERYAFWEDLFASNDGFRVVSPTYCSEHASASDPWAEEFLAQNACGSGPYSLAEFVTGQYAVLTKFPEYWQGWTERNFDKIILRIMLEPATRLAALQNGDIDIAESVPSDSVPALEADPRFSVQIVESGSVQNLFMKCDQGPLANRNLRKAITYAIDYAALRQVLTGALPACGPLPSWLLGADSSISCINSQDLSKAKEYIDLSGYGPGDLKFSYTIVAGNDWHESSALIIQQSLAEIGIAVDIIPKMWAELVAEANNATGSDFYQAYGPSTSSDPYELLRSNYSAYAAEAPSYGWNPGYKNLAVDALLAEAASEPDRNMRAVYYGAIAAILVEDCAVVFQFGMPYTSTYRSDIKGVAPHRLYRAQYYFYDLWREPGA